MQLSAGFKPEKETIGAPSRPETGDPRASPDRIAVTFETFD